MIKAIQEWYLAQCDGQWEHANGIVIETLDNPGWSVRVDLSGTELENVPYSRVADLEPEADWLSCEVRDGRWLGHCGPQLLERVITEFLTWAREHSSRNVT